MSHFEYKNAEAVGEAFGHHSVIYLFFGKSGAILLGYSDTTQDVDLYVQKSHENGEKIIAALTDLGFPLSAEVKEEVLRGKVFIQLRNGPFDLDLIFARDGIERFEEAWRRSIVRRGFPIAHIDDILASKKAANRLKDRESLPRLLMFRDWLNQRPGWEREGSA